MAMALGIVLMLLAAGAIGFNGYRIRWGRRYNLISGWDVRRLADPRPLADWIGVSSLVVAALLVGTTVLLVVFPNEGGRIAGGAGAVVVVAAVVAIFGCEKRYRAGCRMHLARGTGARRSSPPPNEGP